MYVGKMKAIRKQTLWQASLVAIAFVSKSKFDEQEFLRSGIMSDRNRQPVISEDARFKIEVMQGCMRRGLPEPDFSLPDWEEKTLAAFRAHDEEKANVAGAGVLSTAAKTDLTPTA